MRAIIMDSNKMGNFDDFIDGFLNSSEAYIPLYPHLAMSQGTPNITRLVKGNILRDEMGNIYEKMGNRIRKLNHLFSGPNGEIFEVIPPKKRKESIFDKLSDLLTMPIKQPVKVKSNYQPFLRCY